MESVTETLSAELERIKFNLNLLFNKKQKLQTIDSKMKDRNVMRQSI